MKIFLLLLFLISFSGYSQHSIKGKVVNDQNLSLEYSEILLQKSDSTLVTAEVANDKGEFLLTNIPKGNYS